MRFVHSAIAMAALLVAANASAAILYSNSFDAENGGLSALNYSGFNGLNVASGSVDLVANGDFGVTCVGGSGSCVDLNGTTSQTSQVDLPSFNFLANTEYTFSFDLSGNQRGYPDNDWFVGVSFDSGNVYNFFRVGGPFGSFDVLQGAATGGSSTGGIIASAAPFETYSIGFSMQSAGAAKFYIGSNDATNFGPIVDNLVVTGAAVPEPANWAMLITGFGLVGAAARRRRLIAA